MENEYLNVGLFLPTSSDSVEYIGCDNDMQSRIGKYLQEKRKEDKLTYRYPRGESYLDVIARLDPIVHEVERMREPVLIVGHQGILRILYSYFTGGSREEAPFQSIPLNHVIKLEPLTYRCEVERFNLNKGETLHEAPSH